MNPPLDRLVAATSRPVRPLLAGLLALAFAAPAAGDPPSATKTARQPQRPLPRPSVSGPFVLVGGGTIPDSVRLRFLELAGGKDARLVVIPTASELGHRKGSFASFDYWKVQPAASVVLMHTMDRARANEAAFVKPLSEATGVWLSGGDQSRLVEAYQGTAVEKALHGVHARGGVIGGTSAGASAMSSLMIVSGNPEAKVGGGFGLLDRLVIDQHFHNRNRLKRLQGVLEKNPTYVGLGIDEETAVVVRDGKATVMGNANVRVCLPPSSRKSPGVQVLASGDQIDLDPLCRAVRPPMK